MHNFKICYHLNLEGTPTGESYPANSLERQTADNTGPHSSLTAPSPSHSTPCTTRPTARGWRTASPNPKPTRARAGDEQLHNNSCLPALPLGHLPRPPPGPSYAAPVLGPHALARRTRRRTRPPPPRPSLPPVADVSIRAPSLRSRCLQRRPAASVSFNFFMGSPGGAWGHGFRAIGRSFAGNIDPMRRAPLGASAADGSSSSRLGRGVDLG